MRTLKPMVDAGAEWDAKRCEIRTSTVEGSTGKLKKGPLAAVSGPFEALLACVEP